LASAIRRWKNDLPDMGESVENPDFYVKLFVANKAPDDMDKL
jgi:hypothetical protein